MTLRILFYLLAFVIVASTAVAITRKHLAHTVVSLVVSFLGTAALFYLLGAPMLPNPTNMPTLRAGRRCSPRLK